MRPNAHGLAGAMPALLSAYLRVVYVGAVSQRPYRGRARKRAKARMTSRLRRVVVALLREIGWLPERTLVEHKRESWG